MRDHPDRCDAITILDDRHRDRSAARGHLLTCDRVTALANLDKVASQPSRLVDRVSCRPREAFGEIPLNELGRLVGEQHLSHPRRVKRQVPAGATHGRDAPLPHESLHAERLTTIEHREGHVLAGLLIQARQGGERTLA